MNEFELTPDPYLLESMRAVGYSFETAVADVIDNSVAAGAGTIHLLTSGSGQPRVSIFDDGAGMDRETAVTAMKLAARSPSETRKESDLGRFGLGLKTASLSQCRRLTVASKQGGHLTILRWDLDHVISTGRWLVIELDAHELCSLHGHELLDDAESGTLVCWDELDLLLRTEGSSQADFDAAVTRVRDHCSLVFHRFVTGDDARKINMTVNGVGFSAFDPFLRRNRSTDARSENLKLDGTVLPVVAYTLPFIGKLSASERKLALAPGGFRDSQGFYIYRAARLVVWGTWFRLNPKSELGKLARVRVDVPNALDHLWVLDIKKSSATPPRELREALKKLSAQFIEPSTRVQKFRGRREKDPSGDTRVWNVIVDRHGFRYEVNREHPVIRTFGETLDSAQLRRMEALIEVMEQSFPVVDAHNRLGEDAVLVEPADKVTTAVTNAANLRPLFADTHPDDATFISMIEALEPYCHIDGFRAALTAALAV
ncbi:ATP-binding protein [Kineococcus endophyticus]|uniref:ATP-binding protein n=1 Tax=Kineococcus endophyticus TaxID=1181883 RepID=A0ABV3PDU5_9ACTN